MASTVLFTQNMLCFEARRQSCSGACVKSEVKIAILGYDFDGGANFFARLRQLERWRFCFH